jgi:hypothetical protein
VVLYVSQQGAQALSTAGPTMPNPFPKLAPFASLISFDVDSLRPACSLGRTYPFYAKLPGTVLLVFVAFLCTLVFAGLRAFWV